MLPEIGEEGLVFLIKQANTIIHNQRAAKLNREIDELNKKKSGSETKAVSGDSASKGFDVEITQSKSGKNYHLTVNGKRHFFDIPDTQKIVALCYRPKTKSAALKFLYEFFENEREDILIEHGIKTFKSPFFEELFREVRVKFTLE